MRLHPIVGLGLLTLSMLAVGCIPAEPQQPDGPSGTSSHTSDGGESGTREVVAAPPTASRPPPPTDTPLPDGPVAPSVTGETWFNTEPLGPTELQGRVLLVEFWTYG